MADYCKTIAVLVTEHHKYSGLQLIPTIKNGVVFTHCTSISIVELGSPILRPCSNITVCSTTPG